MPLSKKAKLCRDVEKLAIYNDKGIAWADHSESQAAEHRAALAARIRSAVDDLGRGKLPTEFLSALDDGALEQDATGRFYETLRHHFHN